VQEKEATREAAVRGHLGSGNGGAARPRRAAQAARTERPQDDGYQLSQALNPLKGLSVTRGN